MENIFPYGVCECPEASAMCCDGQGPVAFSVLRNGKRLRLCTRCDMSTDEDRKTLVKKTDNFKLYLEFDTLGALCLAFDELKKGDK